MWVKQLHRAYVRCFPPTVTALTPAPPWNRQALLGVSPFMRLTRATAALVTGLLAGGAIAEEARLAPALPSAPSRWVGEPQSWPGLRGHVTLVFVWTFG